MLLRPYPRSLSAGAVPDQHKLLSRSRASSPNAVCVCADTLLDNLTVEEMLMYTAEMKNPVRESLATKKAKVALVLEQLALTSCRNVKIGNSLDRGISGGSSSRSASSGTFQVCTAPGQ